jgi:formiminotetrahydrofolate cyclodeaminase
MKSSNNDDDEKAFVFFTDIIKLRKEVVGEEKKNKYKEVQTAYKDEDFLLFHHS